MARLINDFRDILGAVADAAGIAEDMGMEFVRTLSTDDLRQMTLGQPMEIETRRSFRTADLVLNQIRIGRDRGDGVCVWRLGQ